MSSSSKRSNAPDAPAPPTPFPVPSLAQFCLNELLLLDYRLLAYLNADYYHSAGALPGSSAGVLPPPGYEGCLTVLEHEYSLRRKIFFGCSLGRSCDAARCALMSGSRAIGLGRVPFLPRYLLRLGESQRLIWRCHPDQPHSPCRWDKPNPLAVTLRKARCNGLSLFVLGSEQY